MLLVGGDSFAQFPKTEWVMEEKQNRPCSEWDGKNHHWCELLAKQLNIASESVGIQGGDSATTSYETIRQLHLNENITHCIFFITMPWRVAIREKPSTHERAYKKRMMHYDDRSQLNVNQYYQTPLLDIVKVEGSHYSTIDRDCGIPIDKEHLWLRMDRIPEHEFIQKQLNSITTISAMAKKRGIKMLFSSGFRVELVESWVQEELEETFFHANALMSQPELRSHFNADEHKSILEKFRFEVDNY
tara:strand:+ start:253 stop:987 length:735 start_codon:yes stop_codon:yes gene_type:complete